MGRNEKVGLDCRAHGLIYVTASKGGGDDSKEQHYQNTGKVK